jgi:hypothetical protein
MPSRSRAAEVWLRVFAGDGAKGPRFYDWATARIGAWWDQENRVGHWVLIRRGLTDPADLAQAHHTRDARSRLDARRGKRGARKYDIEYGPLTVGGIRRLLAGLTRPETARHQRHHHLLHWST